jgi:polyisoprenoid-binding protein YceI
VDDALVLLLVIGGLISRRRHRIAPPLRGHAIGCPLWPVVSVQIGLYARRTTLQADKPLCNKGVLVDARISGIRDPVARKARITGYGAHMAFGPGAYQIGPGTGALHVRTAREGVAARVGHDLLIAFTRWSGTVTADGDDPATAHVEIDIEMDSFEIVEGTGGVVPLTGSDRKDITATARRLLGVDEYPHATFASTRITPRGGPATLDGTLEGALTVRGVSVPVRLDVAETGPTSWRATTTVLQTAFAIKPYRAFFGALRLADPVAVEVTVDLAGK